MDLARGHGIMQADRKVDDPLVAHQTKMVYLNRKTQEISTKTKQDHEGSKLKMDN